MSLPMQERIVLITGATNGIGKVAARELTRLGATVVVAGRSEEKCLQTIKDIKKITGNGEVEHLVADLSSMAEVRKLAAEYQKKYDRLDVLLNNAGAMFSQRIETVDGFEQTFALNHLSYFLLSVELLELLKDTAKMTGQARIVNVSSDAHRAGKPGPLLDDPHMVKKFSGWQRYGETKLANILFTIELARRLEGTDVTVNALHPGFVRTSFGHNNGGFTKWITAFAQNLFAITEDKGAETSIYLASSPEVEGVTGKYFYKKKVKEPRHYALDQEAQKRLWELSEELVAQAAAQAEK